MEAHIERTTVAKAKKLGWLSFKFESPGCAGVPDRIFIKEGRVVFIEFKATGKKPRPLQYAIMDRMKQYGAEVHWCDSIEKALGVLTWQN